MLFEHFGETKFLENIIENFEVRQIKNIPQSTK